MNKYIYDLLGVGIGPFNLSLAALLPAGQISYKFLDNKPEFSWHKELMFKDASMQTSFLKDLVTAVDPTNKHSFLNYLTTTGKFYHFLNTGRQNITRMEFEAYCKWVSENLVEHLDFNQKVMDVDFKNNFFNILTENGEYQSKHLCIASGPTTNIPQCAKNLIGNKVFHAKSPQLQDLNLSGKRLMIVGGGQTGIEIFRNVLKGRFGKAESVTLISGRDNLRLLDEGPFTNEIFTPDFVTHFHKLDQDIKDDYTQKLLLASDGNTPEYLQELYNELYLDKFYNHEFPEAYIRPVRWLEGISQIDSHYEVTIRNLLNQKTEGYEVDYIILATGFRTQIPEYLNKVKEHFSFDGLGRPVIKENYEVQTDLVENKIFAMNFSKHGHGIADPQTSLMSWRSAVIANSLLDNDYYKVHEPQTNFINIFN